ncbi:MAG: SRPBCC family protein [Methylocystis sp.]|nr:SRPBCC family protein [Methylocystis sp.]
MTLFALIFLFAVSILIAYISLQPAAFRISRSTMINAPAHQVYVQVNDLRNWELWSPWAKLDPNATTAYEGSPLGVGQSFSWKGNKQVGVGKMTIKESLQDERIRIKLDFTKPMLASHDVQFDFKAINDDQTEVTWSMSGENEFMGKAMNLVMNMERMIGGQYEQGLANLKALVEGQKRIGAA